MNISQANHSSFSKTIYAGNLLSKGSIGLKSTREKAERQQKAGNQIAFWEKQKENLKNMKCDTLEDIARKLEMFHTYEDEIAAVKAAYNQEQMLHIMDEAKEKAEKIAEAAEKMEPKTPEERKEELIEEALGTEESDGILTDLLEDTTELTDELEKETPEEVTEELLEKQEKETTETTEKLQEMILKKEPKERYRPFDARI